MSFTKKILLSVICLFFIFPIFAQEPFNLKLAKLAVTRYMEDGQYQKDVNRAALDGEQYLQQRIQNNPDHRRLAIVLDIDETAISNYKMIKKNDFGEPMSYVNYSMGVVHNDPIKPVLNLCQYAHQHGVSIFFITGRKEHLRKVTSKTLKESGYPQWQGLYLEPENAHYKSAILYKSAIRKALEQKGYDVVLSVGDQQSDLAGGYADKLVKIPNPIYLVP